MESSILQIERPIIFGTTSFGQGNPAAVFRWSGNSDPELTGQSMNNLSVYAVALSPNGEFAASGGRGGFGCVQVWPMSRDVRFEGGRSCSFEGSIYSLEWISDSLIACGTADRQGGLVRFLDVSSSGNIRLRPNREPLTFRHPGYVVGIKVIQENILLTLGEEGLVRLWGLESGELTAEFSCEIRAEPLLPLPSIEVLPSQKEVLVQYPSGFIRLLRNVNGWVQSVALKTDRPVGGFVSVGEHVLVSEWKQPVVNIFNPSSWEPSGVLNFSRPLRRLVALSPTFVAALHLDHTLSVWQIAPEPIRVAQFKTVPIRSIGGGLAPKALAKAVVDAREQDRKNRLNALKGMLHEAHDLETVRRRVADVTENDLGFEALILLADWCRSRGKRMAELYVRKELCRDVPTVKESVIHLKIYGDLLADLDEIKLALEVFNQAVDCDPESEECKQRIQRLEGLSILEEEDLAIFLISGSGNDRSASCEALQQSVLKDVALGREIPKTGALPLGVHEVTRSSNSDLDLNELCERTGEELVGQVDVVQRSVFQQGVGKLPVTKLVRFRPSGIGLVSGLEVLCFFSQHHHQWECTFLLTISTDDECPPIEPHPHFHQWRDISLELGKTESVLNARRKAFETTMIDQAALLLNRSNPTIGQKIPGSTLQSKISDEGGHPPEEAIQESDDDDFLY